MRFNSTGLITAIAVSALAFSASCEGSANGVLFDFNLNLGDKASSANDSQGRVWNNVTGYTNLIAASAVAKVTDARDTKGILTGIQLFLTDGFTSVAVDGVGKTFNASDVSAISDYPQKATMDGVWLYGGKWNVSQETQRTAALRLTGLDPTKRYHITLYGSFLSDSGLDYPQMMDVTINEELVDTGLGSTTMHAFTHTQSYTSGGTQKEGMVTFFAIAPKADPSVSGSQNGVINIALKGSSVSTRGSLNVLEVVQATPPVPVLFDMTPNPSSETLASNDPQDRTWNNVTGLTTASSTAKVANALNKDGDATTINLFLTDPFTFQGERGLGSGVAGMAGSSALSDYPQTATRDGAWIYGDWGNYYPNNPEFRTAAFRLTGLDPAKHYAITFYGSYHHDDLSTPQLMNVTINNVTHSYNAAGSVKEDLATFVPVIPNANGEVNIQFRGNAQAKTGALNAMEVVEMVRGEVGPGFTSSMNVARFGAVGDATPSEYDNWGNFTELVGTDDTYAIQLAWNAARTAGAKLLMPPASYLIVPKLKDKNVPNSYGPGLVFAANRSHPHLQPRLEGATRHATFLIDYPEGAPRTLESIRIDGGDFAEDIGSMTFANFRIYNAYLPFHNNAEKLDRNLPKDYRGVGLRIINGRGELLHNFQVSSFYTGIMVSGCDNLSIQLGEIRTCNFGIHLADTPNQLGPLNNISLRQLSIMYTRHVVDNSDGWINLVASEFPDNRIGACVYVGKTATVLSGYFEQVNPELVGTGGYVFHAPVKGLTVTGMRYESGTSGIWAQGFTDESSSCTIIAPTFDCDNNRVPAVSLNNVAGFTIISPLFYQQSKSTTVDRRALVMDADSRNNYILLPGGPVTPTDVGPLASDFVDNGTNNQVVHTKPLP